MEILEMKSTVVEIESSLGYQNQIWAGRGKNQQTKTEQVKPSSLRSREKKSWGKMFRAWGMHGPSQDIPIHALWEPQKKERRRDREEGAKEYLKKLRPNTYEIWWNHNQHIQNLNELKVWQIQKDPQKMYYIQILKSHIQGEGFGKVRGVASTRNLSPHLDKNCPGKICLL